MATLCTKYRPGSKGHGIMAMLATRPSTTTEIYAMFKGTDGSSILTHMRREGLIEHQTESNTSPWQLTEDGKRELARRGEYTCAMHDKVSPNSGYDKRNRWVVTPYAFLPWTKPFTIDKSVSCNGNFYTVKNV